jgi:hypothetical protein
MKDITGKEFKRCSCSVTSWEVVVVDKDEHFDGKSTVYYHCDACGEDFAILDYDTGEVLYLTQELNDQGD